MTELATKIADLGDSISAFRADYASRISDLEKRYAREKPANDNYQSARPSLGELVANDNAVRELTSNFRGKTVVKISGDNATITTANSTVGAGRSQGTSLIPAHRVQDIVEPYQRRLVVRDLLSQSKTTSNSIEWPRETGFTNAAAPVAEGAQKPYSDLTFDLVSAPVRTIAHMFKASRQILDDAPALQSYIDRRGVFGLQQVEEAQLLNGSGTGQNLTGLVTTAAAFAPTFTSQDETAIDRINQALSQSEDSDIPVTGVVLNRRDWRKIIGTKDLGGNYIAPNAPFVIVRPNLWNITVVATNALPEGKMLTGPFEDGATIFDRMEIEVLLSTENVDDFERNLVSIRVESRLALANYRPSAFIYGDIYAA